MNPHPDRTPNSQDPLAAGLSDQQLLDLLQQSLHSLPTMIDPNDEPPANVVEGARWVHDWVNLEAELAELTFDSTERRELAGVRSTASPLRELTFVTDDHTIELEITPGPRTITMSGTIDPPTPGHVQLVIGGEPFTGELDAAGNFEIRHLPSGTVLALVQVGSSKIRLGSFDI